MASLVETFGRVLGDPALPHLFFIEGDVLAVENAFKCRVRLDGSVQRSLRYRSIAGHSGAALAWGISRPQRLHFAAHQYQVYCRGPVLDIRLEMHLRALYLVYLVRSRFGCARSRITESGARGILDTPVLHRFTFWPS